MAGRPRSAAALERAAIHIARPLGLDPATTPVLDARLDDGSRVAICVPPASPSVAITVRRFGKRSFSAEQLVAQGALPVHIRDEAERVLHTRRTMLVSGGTGSGKTTLLNALIKRVPSQARRLWMARQDKQVPEGAQGTTVAPVEWLASAQRAEPESARGGQPG